MAFPTDYRGKTMVQPDGSYKNTHIPASMKHKTKVDRPGGNYKRHWSQKKSEAQKKREAARKK